MSKHDKVNLEQECVSNDANTLLERKYSPFVETRVYGRKTCGGGVTPRHLDLQACHKDLDVHLCTYIMHVKWKLIRRLANTKCLGVVAP